MVSSKEKRYLEGDIIVIEDDFYKCVISGEKIARFQKVGYFTFYNTAISFCCGQEDFKEISSVIGNSRTEINGNIGPWVNTTIKYPVVGRYGMCQPTMWDITTLVKKYPHIVYSKLKEAYKITKSLSEPIGKKSKKKNHETL